MTEATRTTANTAAYAVRRIIDAAESLGIDLTDVNVGRLYLPQPEVTVYGRQISEEIARKLVTAIGGTNALMGEPYGSSRQQAELSATADDYRVRVIVCSLPAATRLAGIADDDLAAELQRRRAAQDAEPTP